MRVLRTVLVAPSRYDARGVVVFRLGISPNGALGALAGLCEDYNRRHSPDERIEYDFFDEHVREAVTPELLRGWRDAADAAGERFVLMLCGVQTVTYPRARDVALMARREGIEVLAGGVHLSAHGPSVDFLVSCGVNVAIGEVEPIWDDLIEDAFAGTPRTVYRVGADDGMRVKTSGAYMTAPDVSDAPFPHIPPSRRRAYVNPSQLFIDGSRGCPFVCSFCVVKNVFGRTVRGREPEGLVAWMVERVQRDGVNSFSFTDDNFSRNPRSGELLERIAAARAAGNEFSISLILDVEATCYVNDDTKRGEQTRHYLELCRAAGVAHVYIGLESTNDAVLREMNKGVNRDRADVHGAGRDPGRESARERLIARYRAAVDAWHGIGASVECGYILGFASDGHGVGVQAARDVMAIGVDVATFFLLAPLPGSEDFARAVRDDELIEPDFNEFFQHAMIRHPRLSAAEMETEVISAVRHMWSWSSVLRRVARGLLGLGRPRVKRPWTYFKRQLGYRLMIGTGLHNYVEGGLLRRRVNARRHAIGDEDARAFYLGGRIEREPGFDATLRDDSSMVSLPIRDDQLFDKSTSASARVPADLTPAA